MSLDGLDGAGKSTQCRLLVDWLRAQGRGVRLCRDPGGTPLGDRIRDLLLHGKNDPMTLLCEALLYMASRAQLVDQVIRPTLNKGDVQVSDRFLLANVVYQGHAGGLPPERLWELGRLATGGLLPDLTLVLDLPVEVALARKQRPPDRLEGRGVEFLAKVRAGFLAEAARAPANIKVIDAAQPVAIVQESIRAEASRVLDPSWRP